jgi:ParB family chromosome partitioning protein
MKAADRLAARLAANIDESMGARRAAGGAAGPVPGPALGADPSAARYEGSSRIKGALNIEVDRIVADPKQPRRFFEPGALTDLAESLRARGQLQPIRVRWDEDVKSWVIVTGERRWRAAKLAGLREIACVEQREERGEVDRLEDQLVENCVREDLSPIEQAEAFRAILSAKQISVRQLADSLNVSHQSIIRAVRLLDLPDDLRDRVHSGQLAPSVATELSAIPTDEERRTVARMIRQDELNRDEAIEMIREVAERSGATPRPKATRTASAEKRSRAPSKFRVSGGLVVEVSPARSGAKSPGAEAIVAALRRCAGPRGTRGACPG